MISIGAGFSRCRKYRYTLHRVWNLKKAALPFIGLNPSTADENTDDPTIRRCIDFAESFGYGGIIMLNLFAYRCTNPKELKTVDDPIGPKNNFWLKWHCAMKEKVILCFGTGGVYLDRYKIIKEVVPFPLALALCKNGMPKHPLYLKKDLVPFRVEFK